MSLVVIEARRERKAGRGGKAISIVFTPLYLVASEIADAIIAELTKTNSVQGQTFQVSKRIPTFTTMNDFTGQITEKAKAEALAKLSDKDRALLGLPPRTAEEIAADEAEADTEEDAPAEAEATPAAA